MKKRGPVMLFLACVMLVAPWAQALRIGDTAPPITISHWTKQPLTNIFDGDHLTVVELWATWCPYCRDEVPHLTQLQARYKDSVHIVGVSNEPADVVDYFVSVRGATMDYSIGCDDGRTAVQYGSGGIPHAVIVDQSGRVVWGGHPGVMDAPLAAAVDAGVFIAHGPVSRMVMEGTSLTFSITMANDTPVNFAWTRNGQPVGGNSPTLNLQNVTEADEGTYTCTATKVGNSQIHQQASAQLSVVPQGGSLPAASPWGIAGLAAALALAGTILLARKQRKLTH